MAGRRRAASTTSVRRRRTRLGGIAASAVVVMVMPVVLRTVVVGDDRDGNPRPGARTGATAEVAGIPGPSPARAGPATGSDASAVRAAERPRPVGVRPAAPASPPPASLAIPSIGVTTPLERLDLRADGTLEPPASFGRAGWFAAGPAPGQRGPAVIVGHVDSRYGAAVFYRLGDLQPGDIAEVVREDGSSVRFGVTDVVTYAKDAFPTDAVFGPVAGAALRLINCTGVFDETTGHYQSNLVVFAEPV
jgi:hypothetical protein